MPIPQYNPLGVRPRLWAALTVLILTVPAAAFGAPDSHPPASSNDGDVETLLAKVKVIADGAQLFEPDQLEKTLGLKIRGYTDKKLLARDCSTGDSSSVIRTYDIENAWFKAPSGRLPRIPSTAINPGGQAGEPAIAYATYFKTRCYNSEHVRSDSARLDFHNLEDFVCVTRDMLEKQLGVEFVDGSHGAVVGYYSGPGNDRFGTTAQFLFTHFAIGTACAVSLSIEQNERLGYRQRRAFQKYQVCAEHAKNEFCAKTPGVKPNESNRLNEYAIKVCGTELSFIQKEPWTGEPPQPLPKRPYHDYSEGPCAGR